MVYPIFYLAVKFAKKSFGQIKLYVTTSCACFCTAKAVWGYGQEGYFKNECIKFIFYFYKNSLLNKNFKDEF